MNEDNALPGNAGEKAEAGSGPRPLASPRTHRIALRLLALAPIVILSIVVLVFRNDLDRISGLGYFGVFVVNMVASGTFFLPVPGLAAAFAAGGIWNPIAVGLAGALGSTIGELSGYLAGASSQSAIGSRLRQSRWYNKLQGWIERSGTLTLFIFAAVPNPLFDVAGFIAGSLKYHVGRFLFACGAGKAIKYVVVALAGYWGADVVLGWFS